VLLGMQEGSELLPGEIVVQILVRRRPAVAIALQQALVADSCEENKGMGIKMRNLLGNKVIHMIEG